MIGACATCDACAACSRPSDHLDLEDLCPDCSLDGPADDDTFEWCDACAPEPCSCDERDEYFLPDT